MIPLRPIASAFMALLALGGCAEMLRPRVAAPPPAGLLPPMADPVGGALAATTAAFTDQGSGLRSRPAEAARAAAQLEYLVEQAPAWTPVSSAAEIALAAARAELRAAVGVPENATPRQAMVALTNAANALDRRNEGAALAALAPVGGEPTLRRLGDLGALPNAEQATILLTREVARSEAELRVGALQDTGNQRNDVLTEGLGRGF
ncbi:hypothetical protein [Plastoroseomonas arctica]|uniref:Lipoprotein n=1 Tax=Plastoroseomonas arctica TaxID=1509237 RepID=A0AAF1JU63_9PROT|nr:hypothetical protein [Plastoroseomonas arctica]MBR0653632.1 hypothetical protein [Plastoroseomonas arctica]